MGTVELPVGWSLAGEITFQGGQTLASQTGDDLLSALEKGRGPLCTAAI